MSITSSSEPGPVAPLLGTNVDTDAIIPSREMKHVSKFGLADGLFAGLLPVVLEQGRVGGATRLRGRRKRPWIYPPPHAARAHGRLDDTFVLAH